MFFTTENDIILTRGKGGTIPKECLEGPFFITKLGEKPEDVKNRFLDAKKMINRSDEALQGDEELDADIDVWRLNAFLTSRGIKRDCVIKIADKLFEEWVNTKNSSEEVKLETTILELQAVSKLAKRHGVFETDEIVAVRAGRDWHWCTKERARSWY